MLLFSIRLSVLVFAAPSPRLAAPPDVNKIGWFLGAPEAAALRISS